MAAATLLYLHGLNSGGGSGKAAILRSRLAPLPVIAPTYPAHQPDAAVALLEAEVVRLLAESPRLRLIGSSMGGFYGQYLASRHPVEHLYLINPALEPWALLADHLGPQQNFATGERYTLTAGMVAATRRYGLAADAPPPPATLFLDEGDALIDYRIALRRYRRAGRLLRFAGGSHAFDHMAEAVAQIRADLGLG